MQTTTNNSGLIAMGATHAPPTAGGPLSAGNRANVYSASQNPLLVPSPQQPPQLVGERGSIQLPMVNSLMIPVTTNKRSLNRDARKRELLKITMENQAILRRLQEQKPNYDVMKWEEEAQKRKRLLKNICEYPYAIDQAPHNSSTMLTTQGEGSQGPPI